MQPTSYSSRSIPVLPAWLTSRVGTVALAIALVAAIAKVVEFLGWGTAQMVNTFSAAMVVVACGFALNELRLTSRPAVCPVPARRFWRLQRIAVLAITVVALATTVATLPVPVLHAWVRWVSLAASLASMALLIWAAAHIPSGELSARERATASLDITTLIIAGLVAFWILALDGALSATQAAVDSAPSDPDVANTLIIGSFGAFAVITVFTFLSLLLLSSLLLMPYRAREAGVASGLRILGAGVLALIAGEIVPYCYALARVERFESTPTCYGWTLLLLSIGLHARLARGPQAKPQDERTVQSRVSVPYAAIGLIAVLLITAVLPTSNYREYTHLYLFAVFAAFLLVVVRQTVIARENLTMVLEMQRAKEIAESANNARLQFLANISHDLRTPLNGVLGCAQILLREKTMNSKQRELLKTIQGCAEHLRNLINDLLDLSKLEADKLELAPSPFDLKALLAALIKTFALEAETKKIVLELDQAPDLPDWIKCDRKRLHQILGNLVHNAIKFTDHGRVKVRARVNAGALIFEVIDTGCGIMPDKIGELFQPFHVVDERSIKLEGTGLGLSICKKLANKMGGDISVTSRPGKGSTFSVVVPLALATPVVEEQRTVVDYQGRRRRVLIVDDNAANRAVLRAMLEPLDFLIHEADGAEATRAQISQAQPDIVLMDLMMPGTDGFTLCAEILEMDVLRLPVLIAVSAMAGEDVLQRCRKAGFADLLNKPVHLDAIVNALRVHAGIEWTYGVLQPPPIAAEDSTPLEQIVAPPAEEVSAFLDLARRGVVRNIETRAEQLAHAHPEYSSFARRVARYARDFKLKELGEWLSSLSTSQAHGSA
ncbi:MAG: response regulator [Opitutaceae bacterium]|nr:response regulator [Opitutaceae bacterium]